MTLALGLAMLWPYEMASMHEKANVQTLSLEYRRGVALTSGREGSGGLAGSAGVSRTGSAVTRPSRKVASKWSLWEVTAYSFGCIMPKSGKEGPPQRGANGQWPEVSWTVAAPKHLKFGTIVEISHKGVTTLRMVGDRGRAIKGKRLDLFVEDCQRAKQWGRKKVYVRVYH